MVQELTDDTIDQFIKDHEVVILDIYTTWCGPCNLQAKIFDDLAKDLPAKRVVLAKIDADQAPETSAKYQVRAIPTLIMFKDGKPAKTHIGVWPKNEMEKELAELL